MPLKGDTDRAASKGDMNRAPLKGGSRVPYDS